MTRDTYYKSVDKLLDSYNDGSLEHGRCNACAVGNLLGKTAIWGSQFQTVDKGKQGTGWIYTEWSKYLKPEHLSCDYRTLPDSVKEQINQILDELYASNGFTKEELMRIEYVFEDAEKCTIENGYDKRKRQYLGLCAVLEVMETMIDDNQQVESGIERLKTIAHDKYQVAV